MKTEINVKDSRVLIGDVLGQLDSLLPQGRVIVITDASVHRHFQSLINRFEHIIIGQGETIKTLITVDKIYKELIALGADRSTFILAVGGGIVTDIAGYVASTYMRGVRFGFIATTLLSQVDASVGGKNGVNVEGYKNMVGTFNQPDFVLCDPATLRTLPEREFRAGLAEIIKSAIIADTELFELLESVSYEELKSDNALLGRAIAAAVKVKADIVIADEREKGDRKKLNLGHTFAHAIEKCSTEFNHGEAVAIGTNIIAAMSCTKGLLSSEQSARIEVLITKMGLPTKTTIERGRLIKAIAHDKKCEGNQIDLILIESIGNCCISRSSLDF